MAPIFLCGMQNGKREFREKLRGIPLPGTGQVPRFIFNIPRYQVCPVTYQEHQIGRVCTKIDTALAADIMSGSYKDQGELQPYEITK